VQICGVGATYEDFVAGFTANSDPGWSVDPADGCLDVKGGDPDILAVRCVCKSCKDTVKEHARLIERFVHIFECPNSDEDKTTELKQKKSCDFLLLQPSIMSHFAPVQICSTLAPFIRMHTHKLRPRLLRVVAGAMCLVFWGLA
jgi:hypothetical protein